MHTKIRSMLWTALLISLPFFLTAQSCPTHKALLDKMDGIFESGAVDRLGEIYTADAVIHSPDGPVSGLNNIVENMKEFHAKFPNAQSETLDMICAGDKAVVRWAGSGTSMGKKIKVKGITIYQIRDGKVAEAWEEMNMMDLMLQMGFEVKPPEGGK